MGSDRGSRKFLIASTVRPAGSRPPRAGFGKRFGRLPRRMPILEAARERAHHVSSGRGQRWCWVPRALTLSTQDSSRPSTMPSGKLSARRPHHGVLRPVSEKTAYRTTAVKPPSYHHGVSGDLPRQPQRRFGRLLRAANPAGRDHLRVASGHFGPALGLPLLTRFMPSSSIGVSKAPATRLRLAH